MLPNDRSNNTQALVRRQQPLDFGARQLLLDTFEGINALLDVRYDSAALARYAWRSAESSGAVRQDMPCAAK